MLLTGLPVEIEYDSDLDALIIRATGKIVYEDLPALPEAVGTHPKFRTNINQLFDCTEGELALSRDDLKRIATLFMSDPDVLGLRRKLALLVSQAVEFGMMRQYEVFFQPGPHVEVRAFRERSAAVAWLRSHGRDVAAESD